MNIKLQFLGATQTVTGSKYLLSCDDKNFLIDCGLFQGVKELRLHNWAEFPIAPRLINAVILTHAHLDHSGYLPLLVKHGFSGKIYCTSATKDLCSVLLPDSGFLQEEEARLANKHAYSKHKPALPLYTKKEAEIALQRFEIVDFSQECQLTDGVTVKLSTAGHILGAATVLIKCRASEDKNNFKSILFSGDLGRSHDPIMYAPAKIGTIADAVDYLVVESTYGDRIHDQVDPQQQLANTINATVARGGTLVIPAFAVGRTQLILYYIYQLKKNKQIADIPVFLDSPMATNATSIFENYQSEHRLTVAECAAVCGVPRYVNTVEESKLIDAYTVPKIIISASGMASGGRVLHHLKFFASDARNTILFCGYQSVGTRGDKMLHGIGEIKLLGKVIAVNAEVIVLHSMSAHADSVEILQWLATCSNQPHAFITHGELKAAQTLKSQIEHDLHWRCEIPKYLQTYELA